MCFSFRSWIPTLVSPVLLALVGCGSQSVAPAKSSLAVPAALIVPAIREPAKNISELKKTAKVGEAVVVRGLVGGRAEPFVRERAAFVIADTHLITPCDRNPEDKCPQPWDFCCEPLESIVAATATVQVRDSTGQVLAVDLKGHGGLEAGCEVIVRGHASGAGEALSIDAEVIQILPRVPAVNGQDSRGSHQQR